MTLSIEEDEIVSLIDNISGGLILIKTVIGLLLSSAGTMAYNGEDVTGADADDCARIGIGSVPRGRDLFQT